VIRGSHRLAWPGAQYHTRSRGKSEYFGSSSDQPVTAALDIAQYALFSQRREIGVGWSQTPAPLPVYGPRRLGRPRRAQRGGGGTQPQGASGRRCPYGPPQAIGRAQRGQGRGRRRANLMPARECGLAACWPFVAAAWPAIDRPAQESPRTGGGSRRAGSAERGARTYRCGRRRYGSASAGPFARGTISVLSDASRREG
jgi:hypothetical protein